MADEQVMQEAMAGEGEVQPIIPGTTYKTPEEAAKGFAELKTLVDRQGNDLGMTRKQLEQATKLLEQAAGGKQNQVQKPNAPAMPDFDTELAKIDSQIEKLDVDDPSYTKMLATLNKQARALEAQKVQALTEQKLISQFEKTLSEKESQQTQQQWKAANPDFESPEMQQAIQMHMAQDRTGMMDPVLAYREIQLQQTQERMKQLEAENNDYRERLKLKSGEQNVGKVVTKTGGNPGTKTQTKATGAALDDGMRAAFRAAQ